MIVPRIQRFAATGRAPKKSGGVGVPGSGGVPPATPPTLPPSSKLDKMVNALLGTRVYKAFVRANGNQHLPVIKLSFNFYSPDSVRSFPNRYQRSLADLVGNRYVVFGVEKTTGNKEKEYYLAIDKKDKILARRQLFIMNKLGLNSFSCFLHLMEEESRVHLHMVALTHPQMRGKKLMLKSVDEILRSSFAGRTITAHAQRLSIVSWFIDVYKGSFMQKHFIEEDRLFFNLAVFYYQELAVDLHKAGVLSPSDAREIIDQKDISKAYPLLEQKLKEKCQGVSPLQYLCDIIQRHSFDVARLPEFPIQGIVPG
jgi:hypothetical protein